MKPLFSANIKEKLSFLNKAKSSYALFVIVVAGLYFSMSASAQGDDVSRLQDSISNLKSKIRSASTKDPKDIQKLYKLENELQKKQYLRKNSANTIGR